jgi:hypothetical protein
MLQWASIIVVPSVFLANLSLVYALVPLACRTNSMAALNVSNGVSLALALVVALAAWMETRSRRVEDLHEDDVGHATFLLRVGTWISALTALAIALQWSAQLMVSPCHG